MSSAEKQYIDLYRECGSALCRHSSPVMNAPREEACALLEAEGLPTRKVERYKYTDLAPLLAPNYGLNIERLAIPVNPYDVFSCDVPNLSTSLYFIINDAFRAPDRLPALPEGVVVGSLAANDALSAPYYNSLAGKDHDPIAHLNTMLAQDGLLVYVPKNTRVERPIQVINILRGDVDMMTNRRVLIVAEENAELRLLFCDHTANKSRFLSTQVVEVIAKEGAHVELYCMEETHADNVRLSNVYVEQAASSSVTHHVVTLLGGTTRNKLDLTLAGEGAECNLGGCVIADGKQHVDNNTLVTHHAPHCTSNQLYKYVLDDQATGAFAGRVLVEHGMQHTVSQMTNQNICTSPAARMYTQPMLEIYADDVKCGHGSTVGQINDAALFYMRQRGIPEAEARTLLEVAFVDEVIDRITLTPLRDRLHHLVEKRFRGELNRCEGCKLCVN